MQNNKLIKYMSKEAYNDFGNKDYMLERYIYNNRNL